MTIEKSKAVNPNIRFGVCGEQGGEPNSVHFFHKVSSGTTLPIACVRSSATQQSDAEAVPRCEPVTSWCRTCSWLPGWAGLRVVQSFPSAHCAHRRRTGATAVIKLLYFHDLQHPNI